MKRAAHFLLVPELSYSPPNEAIVSALLELGYQVDLYAPGGNFPVEDYGPSVTANEVEYGKRWIAKNLVNTKWRKYHLFSGTTEDPMAVVGILSKLYHRPSFTLADEIRNGSYSGNRSVYWKKICRRAMRHSRFTIVNDESRIQLQREYADLPKTHPLIVYPGSFRAPPKPWDKNSIRESRSLSKDSILLGYSGVFNVGNGGLWIVDILRERTDVYVWGQLVGMDLLTKELLKNLAGGNRLYVEPNRLSWRDAWASMSAVDIGMVVYLQDAPQFRNMGTSSNRLCMFLAMRVPVIASRQPSFEFIEKYECGVLVQDVEEFIAAIDLIKDRHEEMKANALRCAKEYIDAPGKYKTLLDKLSKLG